MPTTIATVPPAFQMATTEELPFGFDTTNLLLTGQSPSSPSVVMTDTYNNSVITLSNAPTILGNVITQIVVGSQLTEYHTYTLSVTFTAATNTVWTMSLALTVPQ